MRPRRDSTSEMTCLRAFSSAISRRTTSIGPSPRTDASDSGDRTVATTWWPEDARRRATARPIPEDAPVTRATGTSGDDMGVPRHPRAKRIAQHRGGSTIDNGTVKFKRDGRRYAHRTFIEVRLEAPPVAFRLLRDLRETRRRRPRPGVRA